MSEWYNDSLENHIKSSQFSTSSLAGISQQILSALSFLHKNGIVHRSLGSENVLLTPKVCEYKCVAVILFAFLPLPPPKYLSLADTSIEIKSVFFIFNAE